MKTKKPMNHSKKLNDKEIIAALQKEIVHYREKLKAALELTIWALEKADAAKNETIEALNEVNEALNEKENC